MTAKIPNVLLMIVVFVFYSVTELFGTTIIKADDPNFQYTGRIDFSVADKPLLFWPGTYIKAKFEGSLLIILLNDQTGQSYYNVFIDEDYNNPYLINCLAGSNIYLISASLADTVHSLMIFRRTEASTGPTQFLGIQINDGKTLLPLPDRPEHKILFYGDSITCGMGNEAADASSDNNLSKENNFLAYGAIASRLLNTDYMCIAKSGIGIMVSWFDMVMHDYYYRLNPADPNSYWDFNEFIPDAVVINLFQNDSWLIGNLNPKPDSTDITNAYIDFVRLIRSHHADALIICSLGSMDATKTGSPWPGYIEKAVEYLQSVENDGNLCSYFFPYDPAWTKHPRVRHHQEMGEKLAAFINTKMGWVNDVEDNYTAQLTNSFCLFQNYPNPFNPTTVISYQLSVSGYVTLKVYDILGNEIATLVNEYKPPGTYEVKFNGSELSSGVYFYKLTAGTFSDIKKFILLK